MTQRSFYTQKLLHTEALHKEAFTQGIFCTQKLLHKEAFTQKSVYTQQAVTQKLLHTEALMISPAFAAPKPDLDAKAEKNTILKAF